VHCKWALCAVSCATEADCEIVSDGVIGGACVLANQASSVVGTSDTPSNQKLLALLTAAKEIKNTEY
jgi:hypothetical protein